MYVGEYLKRRSVPFLEIEHARTMDASRLAEELHVPGCQVAKTVLLRSGDGFMIAIVPSTRYVDIEAVRNLLGVRKVELATEEEANHLFPEVELGVVPPFGSRFGVRTIVDVHLASCESILFEGETHHQAVQINFKDFELLETPLEGMISKPGHAPARMC